MKKQKRKKKKPAQQINWLQTFVDLLAGIIGGFVLMLLGKLLGW